MSPDVIGTLVLTALVGVSLGLLGSGGSIVMLPVLVYVAGMTPQSAVPLSLTVVGAASLVGAVLYGRHRQVSLRAAFLFAASGVPGAWLGSRLTRLVSPDVLMLIFAVLMLSVGARMFRAPHDQDSIRSCYPPRCLLVGALVGGLTGFLGVGGGFLLVPALVWFAGIDTKTAVGTSLAIIALNAAGGVFSHVATGPFPWLWAGGLAVSACGGMLFGKRVSSHLRPSSLRQAFGWFVVLIAVTIVIATIVPVGLR